MRVLRIVLLTSFWLATMSVFAAHTQTELWLSAATAQPGETIWAGLDLKMDPGWHTYWKNPGSAGEATAIKWHLPPGVSAGEIQWPVPQKLPPLEVTTYGYENETVLLIPLTITSNFPPGKLDVQADVSWLECQQVCLPQKSQVIASLNIGQPSQASPEANALEEWRAKLPRDANGLVLAAYWQMTTNADQRNLVMELATTNQNTDFYPDAYDNFEIEAPTQVVPVNGHWELIKLAEKYSGDWPNQISGLFVAPNPQGREGLQATFNISAANTNRLTSGANLSQPPLINTGGNEQSIAPSSPPARKNSLWKNIISGFLGGIILNVMPCVLPVIALKILGFVSEAGNDRRRVRRFGMVYALGVWVSFLILAGAIIAVKAAGHKAAWGMQFGSPIFVVSLITLVTLVALNLFGVFEVQLNSHAMNAAGNLASRHGLSGAFFNGMLATALATPCTAPILGAALGFAFAKGPGIILLIFSSVAAGLAFPYLLLCWNPAWLMYLPKPGAWMEKFKVALGFPMLLTLIWLYQVAADDFADRTIWLGVFLVLLALSAWCFGEFFQRGHRHRGVALGLAVAILALDYFLVLEDRLQWRQPYSAPTSTTTSLVAKNSDDISWQPWSPAAVIAAQNAGKPVLVDFTADWCLTCQVNKKTSIDITSVRQKLANIHAVTLLGDYTHTPDSITTVLNHFDRAGVPLVLVYPGKTGATPEVLPELLTPNIVLTALDHANQN